MIRSPDFLEIRTVTCNDDQVVDKGSGRNQPVFNRHDPAGAAKLYKQLCQSQPRFPLPPQTVETLHTYVKPLLKFGALFTSAQQETSALHRSNPALTSWR
jgi:hypothetical protein